MRFILSCALLLLTTASIYAQGCCSGGSGSPIAGSASTGVLQKFQMEVSGSYQYNYSDIYLSGDNDTLNMIDGLSSDYLFLKVDYGITEKFTMSVAFGYFADKSLIELGLRDTISSKGLGDLILFPRYSIYNKLRDNSRTEITLGMGLKIPLGSATDSNFVGTSAMGDIYSISPPTVQTTTGSQDLMLYSFIYQGYHKRKLRFFASALYVKKGFNAMGIKFGDYASLGLFVGKTIFKNIGLTAQLKGEWIGQLEVAKTVDEVDIGKYSIEIESSGSKKLFFVPQLSYSHKGFTLFATSEIPLYQYLNGLQVGSLYQLTAGLSYRFLIKKDEEPEKSFEITPSN